MSVSVPLSGLSSVNSYGSWREEWSVHSCFRPLIGVIICKLMTAIERQELLSTDVSVPLSGLSSVNLMLVMENTI